MTQRRQRLLLNAEPFGFGPAAAVASTVPLLQKHGFQVSYIGEGHTLDLQKNLGYAATYDTTNMTQTAKLKLCKKLAQEYDVFFTAMDFPMADIAQQAGLKTILYDALTWYWSQVHPSIKNADLYIAQNFFGVEQRLTSEPNNFPAHTVVPPLVPEINHHAERTVVLLNMGGLQNPYWSHDDTLVYARVILDAVKAAISTSETVIVTTSASIARALNDPIATTLSRLEMIETLAKTKLAIMTPGLGNIYDAAAGNIPTLWLPPANDSQGQQAQLLAENDYCDAYVGWSDLMVPIDFSAAQAEVLQNITKALRAIHNDSTLRSTIATIIAKKLHSLSTRSGSKTTGLLQRFGRGGAMDVCSAIVGYLESSAYAGK